MLPFHLNALPIKALYTSVEARLVDPTKAAAVLCTMNDIRIEKLSGIRFIHLPFADVVDEKHPNAFSSKHAQTIANFLNDLDGIVDLYFCCDSGESRSTALMAACYKHFYSDTKVVWGNVHYHPNPLVYRLQCEAFGTPVSRLQAKLLVRYNKHSFKKAIRDQRRKRKFKTNPNPHLFTDPGYNWRNK